MERQTKIPIIEIIGIRITAVLMFIGSLCVVFWFCIHPLLIPVIISLLFIIGSIGLWRMERWGLRVSYLALGGLITLDIIWAIICLIRKEFPGIASKDYLVETMIHFGPPLFATLPILYYLWRKRRYFIENK